MKTNLTYLFTALVLWSITSFSSIQAADYYLSSSVGDDSRTATQAQNPNTPWRSIDKLNAVFSTLRPGDRVYLRRGDTFVGSIRISASGSSSSPIAIGAYGSGPEPIVTSLTSVSGWRSIGSGRFESTNQFSPQRVKTIVIDNKLEEMGRYPNSDHENGGYLRIARVNGNRSLSSTEFSTSANFTGGEVVIRKVAWVIDRHPITSHSGGTVNYADPVDHSSSVNLNAASGFGFFIQNHISTLDKFGEWFYNNSSRRLVVFFGNNNPNNHNVQIATADYLVYASRASNITIQNIAFQGANKDAISIENGSNIKILNSKIEYVGENGIQATGVSGLDISRTSVENVLNNGIISHIGNTGVRITENNLRNIAPFSGGMRSGESNGTGIVVTNDNATVEYNRIENTAFNGISFRRSNNRIANNLIIGFCAFKTDCGGIYGFGGASGREVFSNIHIANNIILNGKGTNFGLPYYGQIQHLNRRPQASGIFLDDNVNNIVVENNTVAHAPHAGISISNATKLIVRNNMFYGNGKQVTVGNYNRGVNTRDLLISGNILVSAEGDQESYIFRTHLNDIGSFGTFSNNYLARPLGDDHSISVEYILSGLRIQRVVNLPSWMNLFGKDRNSYNSRLKLPQFELDRTVGGNLYEHGRFDRSLLGVNCTNCSVSHNSNAINGGTLQVNNRSGDTQKSVRFELKSISKDKHYVLKFKAKANRNGTIKSFLRFSGAPWIAVTNTTAVELSTQVREYSVLFSPKLSISNPALVMENTEGDLTFWLDDIELYEAQLKPTKPEEVILFEYNASRNKKRIPLSGEYESASGTTYSGSIELDAYSSAVLIRKSGKHSPNVTAPLSVNIQLSESNPQYSAGDAIQLAANVEGNSLVERVEFHSNGNRIGTSTSSPYQFRWTNVPAGQHKLTAKAVSSSGAESWSNELSINILSATSDESSPPIAERPSMPDGTFSLHWNLGDTQSVQYLGNNYAGESNTTRYFNASSNTFSISSSANQIFNSERFGSEVEIAVPVPNGTYTVKTLHNELWFGKDGPTARAGQRVFNIAVEGEMKIESFDLFRHNNNAPSELTFREIEVNDGVLNIDLRAIQNNASISGLSIQGVPNASQHREYHINLGEHTNTAYSNFQFVGERNAGATIRNANTFTNFTASSHRLFQFERFGQNISIEIPVENGSYRVVTYHNELWFGKAGPNAQLGQRVFDIFVESQASRTNIDLFRENSNRETSFTFRNVVVLDGVLNLNLVAKSNNATISAISVISENSTGTNLRTTGLEEVENLDISKETTAEMDDKTEGVKIYPNPVIDRLHVEIDRSVPIEQVALYDISGKLIKVVSSGEIQSNSTIQINTSELNAGVYILNLVEKNQTNVTRHRIIKSK